MPGSGQHGVSDCWVLVFGHFCEVRFNLQHLYKTSGVLCDRCILDSKNHTLLVLGSFIAYVLLMVEFFQW